MISLYDIDTPSPRASPSPEAARLERPAIVAIVVLGLATVCALVLALPGQTVTTKYLPDLFVLLDGAFRVASGQVPNRDFHTILGPLVHYLPATGLRLSGSLGAAVPIGLALFILLLAPTMAYVLASRLRATIALPFAAFLILILAVPINLGETVTSLSFGRFYNRLGWAALATLLIMYLRPRSAHPQPLYDALAAAVLVLVMLYTKVTYAVAALAFVLFMLSDALQRRWAVLSLVIVLAGGLLTEVVWGSSRAYFADLLLTYEVSGGLRGTAGQIADHLLRNLADAVLFGLFAGLALWRSRSLRDLLFYGFCAVAGFILINQNFQAWGIISLYAAAAVAAETLVRSDETTVDDGRWRVGLGAPIFLLALVLPTIVHCTIALGMHAALAGTRAGQEVALPNLRDVRLVHLWTWGEHESATRYLDSLQDGARALGEFEVKPDHVFVLDMANPFSAALGLQPARGDTPSLLWGRTLDATHFVPAEQLLQDVRIVMEPKLLQKETPPEQPNSGPGVSSLRQVYGDYIAANFDLVRETEHWRVHRRRQP